MLLVGDLGFEILEQRLRLRADGAAKFSRIVVALEVLPVSPHMGFNDSEPEDDGLAALGVGYDLLVTVGDPVELGRPLISSSVSQTVLYQLSGVNRPVEENSGLVEVSLGLLDDADASVGRAVDDGVMEKGPHVTIGSLHPAQDLVNAIYNVAGVDTERGTEMSRDLVEVKANGPQLGPGDRLAARDRGPEAPIFPFTGKISWINGACCPSAGNPAALGGAPWRKRRPRQWRLCRMPPRVGRNCRW